MKTYPFYSVKSHVSEMYGIDMDDDFEFETIAMSAWEKIGNRNTRLYKYCRKICDYKVELPCNADIVESVHLQWEDFKNTSNLQPYNYMYLTYEHFIESQMYERPDLHTAGKYAKYTQEGSALIFPYTDMNVTIVYKGVLADEDGLPMLNNREVEAISSFCAYVKKRKEGMATMNQIIIQMAAQMLKPDWDIKCANARVAEYYNQNEMNDVLDAITSWDRKRYGKSYKPIK